MNQSRNDRPVREDLRNLRVDRLTQGLPQARAWCDRILQEIQKIQTQVGMPNRLNARGQRLSAAEYHDWRSNALYAKQSLEQQRRELRAYIRQELTRRREAKLPLHEQDPESLLLNLYRLNRRVLSQANGLQLSEPDQTLLDVIRGRFFLIDS